MLPCSVQSVTRPEKSIGRSLLSHVGDFRDSQQGQNLSVLIVHPTQQLR